MDIKISFIITVVEATSVDSFTQKMCVEERRGEGCKD